MAWANEQISSIFREMAELLELSGDQSFRVRAYDRASRALSGYGTDVATMSDSELARVPGLGKSMAAKVREYLEQGRVSALEDLRATVPEGLRVLVRVPGVGPRKGRLINERLGVETVEDLTKAVMDGRIAGLPGMGARTEENLRRALERMAAASAGIPLATALPIAETLRDQLAGVDGVRRVEVAGSLRRMKPVVHDMDLLAAADDPGAITRAFTGLTGVAEVAALGDTKASVRTRAGHQVDLRVVRPEVWGAALQYFTGSKEHNVKVRELAVKQSLKLSEYGLHTREGELVVSWGSQSSAGAAEAAGWDPDEAAVYERLGLAWVPPVLREDRGEVEAARAGELPALIAIQDVRGDFHCHTDMSPDGTASLVTMVDAARERGYGFLAITDHAERLSFSAATRDDFLRQRQLVRELQRRRGDIELLHGVELNIGADGSLDYDDEFLNGFDVLVASVHDGLNSPREQLTARLVRACEHPAVNVIGHPTGRRLGKRPAGDVDLEALCAAAARTGTALEVNGSPERLDLGEEALRVASRHGVRLAFGSDSHGPGHLANMRFSVATAGRGRITRDQVVNALPPEELRRFLAKGRGGR
jgi:DNA polymerase (family 10)